MEHRGRSRRPSRRERPAERAEATGSRFSTLPAAVPLDDTVSSQPTRPAPDPEGGRDTDRDFLIRYGFGG